MKKICQLILVLYLAIGIAVSGYFYLYPYYHKIEHKDWLLRGTYYYEEGNEFGISVLATLVGSILIGGIGILMRKPK